jgi:hypothetical protein
MYIILLSVSLTRWGNVSVRRDDNDDNNNNDDDYSNTDKEGRRIQTPSHHVVCAKC